MQEHDKGHQAGRPYLSFSLELALDFLIMYFVMYTMINTIEDLYININNVYMTLMMITPMAILMLITMRNMFPNRGINFVIIAFSMLVFVVSFYGMRTQLVVGNEQFLRSMIPHHSGAVLMCEQATITDPEIVKLCSQIVPAQREEIAQMRALLDKYK